MYIKVLYLSFILLLSLPALSNEQIISISGNADKPPKIWLENQEPKGILVDILKYAEQKMPSYRYKVRLLPWKRAYQSSVNGLHGIVGISKTKERLPLFDYSIPLYFDEIILVVNKSNPFVFKDAKDLKGKRIGICRGCSFGKEYEEAKAYFTAVEDNDNAQRLRSLLKGRIDAAIISPGEHAFRIIIDRDSFLKQHQGQLVVLKKRLALDPNYLAFSKTLDNTAFIKAFNQVISTGYARGDIQEIIKRY